MKYIEFLKAKNEVNIEMLESSNVKDPRSRKNDRLTRDGNNTNDLQIKESKLIYSR